MKLRNCIGCGLPVLELRGQFTKLDSFYIEQGQPPPESAGWWHLRCLHDSPHGVAWHGARARNLVQVRRYQEVAASERWTVVRQPNTREHVAVARTGEALSLVFAPGKPRKVEGGAVYRVDEEYNLELDNRTAVQAIQDALKRTGVFPVLALTEVLEISDRLVHVEALEGSVYRYDRALAGEWQSDFVSMRADYGVFVPAELEAYVSAAKR